MPGNLPPRRRAIAIERVIGAAPQFERIDGGYLYRRDGHGPAIRVTAEEHDALTAGHGKILLLHAAALGVFGWLGWLVTQALLPRSGEAVVAAAFGVVLSLIALALYLSLRRYADAPWRALRHRPPERPARDPDASRQPAYRTIAGLVLLLLFLAAIGTRQPATLYVTMAVMAVMLGLFLTVRRWRFGARLTPEQRRHVAAEAARERAARRSIPGRRWRIALLLLFVLVEAILLLAGVVIGIGIVQGATGATSDTMTFGLFMIGFLLGMALGGLIVWPVDRLCKRWTGESAAGVLDFIPAGW